MKLTYFFLCLQYVHFLNVEVTDIIGPLRIHPSVYGRPACLCNGGHKKIFPVPHRVIRQMTGICRIKPQNPFLNSPHITGL